MSALNIIPQSDNIHLLIGKPVHKRRHAKCDQQCKNNADNADYRSVSGNPDLLFHVCFYPPNSNNIADHQTDRQKRHESKGFV